MEALIIPATADTPKIAFDPVNGRFEISSRSLPEDAIRFYSGVMDWFRNYLQHPVEQNTVDFHFDYVSTSSAKQLIPFLTMLNELSEKKKVIVNWKYDKGDTDMLETGKRLQKLCRIPFSYSEV